MTEKATAPVLEHVARAREELNKAIAILEHAKWSR